MCYLLNYTFCSKEILVYIIIIIHVEIPQWLNHYIYVEAPFGSELDLKMQVGGGVRVRGLGGVGWWC